MIALADNRKRRGDAWDQALSEEQQAQVRDRFRRFPWYEVSAWIHETFHVEPPSKTALYKFREWYDAHEEEFLLRQRLRDKQALEREVKTIGVAQPEQLAGVLMNDIAAARAKGDDAALERALRMFQVVGASVEERMKLKIKEQAEARAQQQLALAREKFEAAERRARQADDAEQVLKSDLTPEEKDRRYREIFGMAA